MSGLFQTYFAEGAGVRLNFITIAAATVGAFVLFRSAIVVYRLFFHPLRNFPGPKLWAATDLLHNYTNNVSGTGIFHLADLHRKYGPAIRVGPDRLALDGSIGWSQVYARRTAGNAEFEKTHGFFNPGMEVSIIGAPRDAHRRQRRQLGHAFSDAVMHEQEGTINDFVQLLVQRVQEHAAAGKVMNIVQWLNFTTFDIVGDLTFGESFGSLAGSDYHPWVLSLFDGLKADSFLRACRQYPKMGPILKFLFGGRNPGRGEDNRALARLKGKKRLEQGLQPKGRKDFTTYMMQPNRAGEPGLSPIETIANAPLLVVAGSETTASALSGFFFYLNMTPKVKKILMDEIRSAFGDVSDINMVSTNTLEYLHATLEETLRIYPPAAATPPRCSPGAEIDGQYVPKGTVVHVTQWVTFRNPDNFLDPLSFCPERWLRKDHPLYDTRFDNDNRAVFKPFSAGPRDCIGKNLAYSEMRLIVTHLLYRFDVEMLPGQEDWHSKQKAFPLWDKGPLDVKFTKRKA